MSVRVLSLLLASVASVAGAQATAVRREPLQTADFPGNGLHTVIVRTTIDPAGTVAAHTHPGLELAYVAAGVVEVTIVGAAPRRVAAGQSFQIAPRTRHVVHNAGTQAAVVVSTYVVDPAAPIATPAP
ncbi:MAG: cupin domain-containing protein [Janthinobacterium lividum]